LEARHPGGYEEIYKQRRRPEYWDNFTAIRNVLPLEEYVDYWIAEQSIEFLNYPGPKPFFLWCGFCGPHAPIDPPSPYDEIYPFDEMPLPKSRNDDPKRSPKGQDEAWWGTDLKKALRWRSFYWGLVTLIDDMIGRLVSFLEERGLLDNTLIIFTSDHGDMACDYNMVEKGNFYEEVVRVPLFVVPPGGEVATSRVGGLVETSDIAPTILDYAGVQKPPQMQTRSLRPILEGRGEPRESILSEFATKDKARKGKCLRTDRYKYVFWGRDEVAEFYDLQEDPEELVNLVGDPGHRDEIERHKELLLDRLLQSDQFYFRDETPRPDELRIWM
jgi:arylsulfatase A-like enzyme